MFRRKDKPNLELKPEVALLFDDPTIPEPSHVLGGAYEEISDQPAPSVEQLLQNPDVRAVVEAFGSLAINSGK
jgi:hypothetical protein